MHSRSWVCSARGHYRASAITSYRLPDRRGDRADEPFVSSIEKRIVTAFQSTATLPEDHRVRVVWEKRERVHTNLLRSILRSVGVHEDYTMPTPVIALNREMARIPKSYQCIG